MVSGSVAVRGGSEGLGEVVKPLPTERGFVASKVEATVYWSLLMFHVGMLVGVVVSLGWGADFPDGAVTVMFVEFVIASMTLLMRWAYDRGRRRRAT